MKELLDDVGILLGKGLSHARAGVFRRYRLEHLDELMECDIIEILHIGLIRLGVFELALRIVDESAEVADVLLAQRRAEYLRHLSADVARGVAQYMGERLVLSMEVGHEMLRALRQVEDGLEIYDLGAGRLHVGKRLGEQTQYPEVSLVVHPTWNACDSS